MGQWAQNSQVSDIVVVQYWHVFELRAVGEHHPHLIMWPHYVVVGDHITALDQDPAALAQRSLDKRDRGRNPGEYLLRGKHPVRRLGWQGCRVTVLAAAEDNLSVNAEAAAVDVEERLLAGNQTITSGYVCLGRCAGENTGLGGGVRWSAVLAAAGDDLSVNAEAAAVDVEERFLVGNQTITSGYVRRIDCLRSRARWDCQQ